MVADGFEKRLHLVAAGRYSPAWMMFADELFGLCRCKQRRLGRDTALDARKMRGYLGQKSRRIEMRKLLMLSALGRLEGKLGGGLVQQSDQGVVVGWG